MNVRNLIAFLHVKSVPASIEFYRKLGFTVKSSHTPDGAREVCWVHMVSDRAEIMLGAASAPIDPSSQAVMFYTYCDDVPAMHAKLKREGLNVGAITEPFYNREGEFRVFDPDGYSVFVAHV